MTGTQPTDLDSPLSASSAEANRPLASVIIRNRNERQHLEPLLRALSLQVVRPEVVVVDNESTDGSAEMAAANGARLVHITKSEFTYGRAINVGVANASAEIIIMLSSHSLPLGDRFIEGCLAPFADAKVAAVRCIRLERADEWLNPPMLEGPAKLDTPWWSWMENNGCAFRKSVWQEIPFDEQIEAAEDRLWCHQALNAGYRIATAQAWYRYTKTERFWPSLRKYRREITAIYRMTGQKPPLPPPHVLLQAVLVRAPAIAVHGALKVVLWATVAAMVPFYARRPPRAGSVR
jgi:rhamnosyltransferase